ncbi:hypothetical protein SAM23877_3177 [Streptomyces ambofaciens ATCC 23877]|uniref:Uncharacterized protein n=1 Tax=Streptomyces ambofaciens (strain ATCC 23877 / 3486 / DSM 40053 / JCM 4204 / NBRC 12836 / NRRL B-2516) TaxID=278992 RepID=A0A0K2ATG6_STRA7|nr:hypothetical protein SAM23877_3177 [Streptomyces ambofaciens ATCC 23877]
MVPRQEPESLRVLADTYPGSRSDSAVRSDYFPDVRPGKRRPPRETAVRVPSQTSFNTARSRTCEQCRRPDHHDDQQRAARRHPPAG